MTFTIKFKFQDGKYSAKVEAESPYGAMLAFHKLILSKLIVDSIEGEEVKTPPKNPFDNPDLGFFKDIFGME